MLPNEPSPSLNGLANRRKSWVNIKLMVKIFVAAAASALIIRLLLYIIYNNFTLKALYYRIISPVLKY